MNLVSTVYPMLKHYVQYFLRHAVTGLAMVAVLISSVPTHLHTVDHACAPHAVSDGVMAETACADTVVPEPCDPDDRGHCHCSPTMVGIAEPLAVPMHTWSASRRQHPVSHTAPDSISYSPDPPPVRLN